MQCAVCICCPLLCSLNLFKCPVVDFIFAGELLKDEKTLDSYGIKDGFTVYVMKKNPEPEPIGENNLLNCMD